MNAYVDASPDDVRQVLFKVVPDASVRRMSIEFFAHAIRTASLTGPEKWGVTLYTIGPQLIVGKVTVSALMEGGLWTALDAECLPSADRSALRASPAWERTPKWDCRRIPALSGYLRCADCAGLAHLVMRSNDELIAKAGQCWQELQTPSQRAHSPAVLEVLRQELRVDLPSPAF